MPRKEPMLNDGVNKLGMTVILAVIVFAVLMVYYDPAPNPKPAQCAAGEISVPAQDGQKYCVQARKP